MTAPLSARGPIPVLAVDDDSATLEFLTEALRELPLRVYTATDAGEAVRLMKEVHPRLVLLDLLLPGVTGFELMDRLIGIDPSAEIVLATGMYSTDSAVEAIQRGALDYLVKPVKLDRLHGTISKWLSRERARQRSEELEAELAKTSGFGGIVGRSPIMLDVISTVQRLAPHYETALVTGDTGTGKELFARYFHDLSPVASGPFVVCNSAAVTDTLFESELFGYLRGAFTGAVQDKPGLVEAAHNGTLFLDEIGEIPLITQAKLLRFLQSREVRRLGANVTRKVSVRLVAATNRNLREMVREGKFRDDLFYRLATVEVRLPTLADRKEDLPLLIRHFLKRNAERLGREGFTLSRRAASLLTSFPWPGNVRELESVLSYACMMARSEVIDVADLPDSLHIPARLAETTAFTGALISLDEAQRRHAQFVLKEVGGNRSRAAEILQISRATLYRIIPHEKT